MIESSLTFFDEHYRLLASRRGRKALDGDGHLILFPGSACETYKMTNNASSTIAALRTVLETYIKVCNNEKWQKMLETIPPVPLRYIEVKDSLNLQASTMTPAWKQTISPAKSWERINNIETPQLYPVFPWRIYGVGKENLEIVCKILGLPKSAIMDALELVGLTQYKDRLAKKYSLGMKQRLGLASALIGRPPILILDEPTNGLDPVGIHEIRTLIRSLPQKFDCTVLVSSHLLAEIELMANNIGILNHGRLLFEGSLDELKQRAVSQGYPTDNLEDTFLALINADNRQRGGAR